MSVDPTILSYHESLLRQSDIELLNGPYWLNDNVISFYFEYLGEQHPEVLFISPEVTQCIKMVPSTQINIFLDAAEYYKRTHMVFAFNDNDSPQIAGGTHWSLLVFSRLNQIMYHIDSSKGSNQFQAKLFAQKLFGHFNIEGTFREADSLQQQNGYDCGIYLVTNAHFIAKFIAKGGNLKSCDLKTDEIEKSAKTMREQLLNLIEKLRK